MANWVFRQLGRDKKILTLEGWSAPFGRPRKGAIVRDGLSLRHRSTRYPGNDNSPPTRHIFGITYHDFDLNGRFRDRAIGKGQAKLKVEEVKSFMKDAQTCDISWGDTIHVTGIIAEFDPGRESEGEIEWKMKILIDNDNMELRQVNFFTTPNPNFLAGLIQEKLKPMIGITKPSIGIQVNVLDAIDDLVSVVTGSVGQLVNIVNSLDNFEQGLASEGKRLIAGIHQAKTALLKAMTLIESSQQDTFFIRDSAKDTIIAKDIIADATTQSNVALSLMSDLENQCISALQGDAKQTVRVQQGDTFESISNKVFGGPQEADNIRKANGVKYGAKPVVGSILIIPRL